MALTFKTKKARTAFVGQLNQVRQRMSEGQLFDAAFTDVFGYDTDERRAAAAHIQSALPAKFQRKRFTSPTDEILRYLESPRLKNSQVLARLDIAIDNAKTAVVTRGSKG